MERILEHSGRDALQKVLREPGKAVIVTGAGVSRLATNNAPCSTWTGLINNGLERCVHQRLLDPDLAQSYRALLDRGGTKEYVSVAQAVVDRLSQNGSLAVGKWLADTIGNLTVASPRVVNAIRALSTFIATTNYDDVLTAGTTIERLTWQAPERIVEALQKNEFDRYVFHLHGHWKTPQSIVLGGDSYKELLGYAPAEAVQKFLAMSKALIFVGFGAGLQDPNFESLFKWIITHNGGGYVPLFRLVCTDEMTEAIRQKPYGLDLQIIEYGRSPERLPDFLEQLAPPQRNSPLRVARGSGPIQPVEVLTDKAGIQGALERIMAEHNFRPAELRQTLIRNNPVSPYNDILGLVQNKAQCKVLRVICISQPADIYFAEHSLRIEERGGFHLFTLRVALLSAGPDYYPACTNYTVIGSHVLLSLPSGALVLEKARRPGFRGLSSGLLLCDPEAAREIGEHVKAVAEEAYLSTANLKAEHSQEARGLSDTAWLLRHAKALFWRESKANYLLGVAHVIGAELRAKALVRHEQGDFCGVVGSVACQVLGKARLAKAPGDLDLVIVVDSIDGENLRAIGEVVKDVCLAYSIPLTLKLVPEFRNAPIRSSPDSRNMSVQVLLHTRDSLASKWAPFVYYDRRENHVPIVGQFPDVPGMLDFDVEQVITMQDGLEYCAECLDSRAVVAYRWRAVKDSAEIDEFQVKLDSTQVIGLVEYSIHWAIVNLSRAMDSGWQAHDIERTLVEFVEAIRPKLSPSAYLTARLFLEEDKKPVLADADRYRAEAQQFLKELGEIARGRRLQNANLSAPSNETKTRRVPGERTD